MTHDKAVTAAVRQRPHDARSDINLIHRIGNNPPPHTTKHH
jgi:hypothetical protein